MVFLQIELEAPKPRPWNAEREPREAYEPRAVEYFEYNGIRSIAVAVRAFQLAHNDWRRRGARCDAAGGRTSDFTADIATARRSEPDPYYIKSRTDLRRSRLLYRTITSNVLSLSSYYVRFLNKHPNWIEYYSRKALSEARKLLFVDECRMLVQCWKRFVGRAEARAGGRAGGRAAGSTENRPTLTRPVSYLFVHTSLL
ncbi:unnamed protein product [Leptosia nina]|uniref:Uncharacterized protein n=1 Tax=Leptosia nina TaxID=320188 RepID=A0AAV1J7V2_9NEOP